MMRIWVIWAALALAGPVWAQVGDAPPRAAFVSETSPQAVAQSLRPVARRLAVPPARWDGAPGRRGWSLAVLSALDSHARALPKTVPADIAAWCPAYASADEAQRAAFWLGLVSALTWHESTHRPRAVGGDGRWYGLSQIYPPTARHFGCRAQTGEALLQPAANLSCALRIMARTVQRDGVVSRGMRGVAADWGPFHSERKREDMRAWVRAQPYCRAAASPQRPVARPGQMPTRPVARGQAG